MTSTSPRTPVTRLSASGMPDDSAGSGEDAAERAARSAPGPARWRRVLASDVRRAWWAQVLVWLLVPGVFLVLRSRDLVQVEILFALTVWTMYSVSYSFATHVAFRGLRGEALRDLVVPRMDPTTQTRTGRLWRVLLTGGDAQMWAVSLGLIALTASLSLALVPALREIPGILILAVGLVASSWVAMWTSYALGYARLDARENAFAFPGEGPRSWTDYLYLSLSVQTTLGATDVSAVTTRARRTLMGQAAVAFAYNTVIVAILVSLLLSAASG